MALWVISFLGYASSSFIQMLEGGTSFQPRFGKLGGVPGAPGVFLIVHDQISAVRPPACHDFGMTLELSPEEVSLLTMLIKWRLGGLNVEIDHTDNREFLALLRRQRGMLEALASRLEPQPPKS